MNTIFNEDILDAMHAYNIAHAESEKFTLVDARILNLVYSSQKPFYESNEYLAAKCMVSQMTVQKSINKLVAHGFILKSVYYIDNTKRRVLTYKEDVVNQFVRAQP